ncbi:hypothetical protein QCA50_004712 [Cerrena zonata]|uniref:Uncharacterized protein n=1 Tax=Cerrena zonata TaxID=2478898 RepID=A0AAW0FC93_9APHY
MAGTTATLPPPTWPQPADLFTGTIKLDLAGPVVCRYYRIGHALYRFVHHPEATSDTVRRRWRIGLHTEVVALKQAISALMISGCTGGPFFARCTFPWLNEVNPDLFIIDWSKVTPLPHFPLQMWMTPYLVTVNDWWTYDPQQEGTPPVWWNATEAEVADFLPLCTLPVSIVDEQKRLLQESNDVLRTLQRLVSQPFARTVSK